MKWFYVKLIITSGTVGIIKRSVSIIPGITPDIPIHLSVLYALYFTKNENI